MAAVSTFWCAKAQTLFEESTLQRILWRQNALVGVFTNLGDIRLFNSWLHKILRIGKESHKQGSTFDV